MKFDLHVHTRASYDAISSLDAVIAAAKRRNLQGVAITEHNVLSENRPASGQLGLEIIWGEEIATSSGEIIGLFLQQAIPAGLSPEETISAIRAQGGVTYLPHPLKQTGRKPWSRKDLDRILHLIDVVEVFNGRLLDGAANHAAAQLAKQAGALMGAGSDAHTPWEVGRASVAMAAFDSPSTFLQSLRGAQIFGRPPSRLARMLLNRFSRKLLRHLLLTQEQNPLLKKLWLPF
jgi:predicted metal-dependent phosphoesterase TrpH